MRDVILSIGENNLNTLHLIAATGQEPLTLKGHTGGVTSVALSADGKRPLAVR